jgi:hypothetical protein
VYVGLLRDRAVPLVFQARQLPRRLSSLGITPTVEKRQQGNRLD